MKKLIAAGAIALGLVSISAPTFAQGIEFGPNGVRLNDGRDQGRNNRNDDDDGISQREAVRIARSEGLRDVDSVSERRRSFRVEGADRRGRDITVDVDKFSGNVLSVR
ncbi:PepSY domain-containing protein [Aureimonas leprariae]|nr:PepSY domain-containing protein [Aureimonas leprariae]